MLWKLREHVTNIIKLLRRALVIRAEPPMDSMNPAPFNANELASNLLPELRRLAKMRMRTERFNHTLQPTELVGELYLRLLRRPDFTWKDRNHFLRSASQAMRHFLIDYARERQAGKRGGDPVRLELNDVVGSHNPEPEAILDLDGALHRLAEEEPRMAEVVELHYFGGLTFEEIGAVLSMSERNAKRDWTLARKWLQSHLSGVESDEKG